MQTMFIETGVAEHVLRIFSKVVRVEQRRQVPIHRVSQTVDKTHKRVGFLRTIVLDVQNRPTCYLGDGTDSH
jgi:hypothetical protein